MQHVAKVAFRMRAFQNLLFSFRLHVLELEVLWVLCVA